MLHITPQCIFYLDRKEGRIDDWCVWLSYLEVQVEAVVELWRLVAFVVYRHLCPDEGEQQAPRSSKQLLRREHKTDRYVRTKAQDTTVLQHRTRRVHRVPRKITNPTLGRFFSNPSDACGYGKVFSMTPSQSHHCYCACHPTAMCSMSFNVDHS